MEIYYKKKIIKEKKSVFVDITNYSRYFLLFFVDESLGSSNLFFCFLLINCGVAVRGGGKGKIEHG